jgi:dihydroorotase
MKGPVFSMSNVLSKFLCLGYALDEILAAVTSNAAEWLGKPELGRIQVGDPVNLTLFTLEHEPTVLVDSEGEERVTDKVIQAKGVVIGGEFIKCEIRA